MNKQIITAFILGGIITAFCFHAYTVYQIRTIIAQHDTAIGEIVNFINKATASQTPQQPTQ